MSNFDKEAEREKLRKKFEQDQKKRETTQRMSELLLKGATMTNRHCDNCGDPIFRYEGEEFCATCQAAVTETAVPEDDADVETEKSLDVEADAATAESNRGEDVTDTTAKTASSGAESNTSPSNTAPSNTAGTRSPTDQSDGVGTSQRTTRGTVSGGTTSGDLSEARAALVRTVTRYTTEAEAADDPRRARELLSAAREAAETLAALNR